MDLFNEKQRIRDDMQILRRGVSLEQAQATGDAVAGLLRELPEFVAARRVALYLSLPDELPADSVLSLAYSAGKEVLVPRVVSGTDGLEFVPLSCGGPLECGALGVREPPSDFPAVPWMKGDLVLVPGVAFDRLGGRLGRGAGYYDRALSKPDARGLPIWGLGYAFQLIERVPREAHDQRVAGVITEEGSCRCVQ